MTDYERLITHADWSRMSERRHADVDRRVMAAVMVAFFCLVLGAQRGWF